MKLKTDIASTQHQLGKRLAPQGRTHTHILILSAWRQKALKLSLSLRLVSDKIIPAAILGQRTENAFYMGTENLLYNPLPCRPDLLLAAGINLIFLLSNSNKVRLFGSHSPNWFRWSLYSKIQPDGYAWKGFTIKNKKQNSKWLCINWVFLNQ